MRLTLLTAALSPAAGGLSESVPHLAHGVARAGGADIHVVGVADRDDPAAAERWGPNVHAHRCAAPRAFRYAPGMARTMAALAPSLIDVQGLWTYPSLVNLRHHRRHGTPYVVTPHGMLDPWARNRSRWKKRVVRLLFEDQHLARAACLRATAPMEAENFRAFGLENPIAVVPNGVTIPQPRRDHGPRTRRRMLFLSRIHPKKGIDLLLQAWAGIEAQRPEWDLVIAGPDEIGHAEEMKALAQRLGLRRVQWLPATHGEAKTSLYHSADCFVLPTHAENFGLVVAEALAHGVPVITTRNAPWEGLLDHRCGWWIDLSVPVLQSTLTEATACPSAALDEMGARGRAWMERDFGWDGIARNMLTVYDAVLRGERLPEELRFD